MTTWRKWLPLGRVVYYGWHWPIGQVRASAAAGGPLEQLRTARGRAAMRAMAAKLPVPSVAATASPIELHLLTGQRFWDQTAFCLWSFAAAANRAVRPIVYDDGTLSDEHRGHIARLFPLTRFVSQTETLSRLDTFVPRDRFPHLRERWLHYPNIRKLLDVHAGSNGWKLVIDSDLLFFRAPEFLVSWHDHPTQPLHAVDVETCYGYPAHLLNRLAGAAVAERVNVGLCGLRSESLDWEQIEYWCRSLITAAGTHYYLEQALVAMLAAGRSCAIAPAAEYVTLPRLPEVRECRAVMHHYVAESKPWYFRTNWRTAMARHSNPSLPT